MSSHYIYNIEHLAQDMEDILQKELVITARAKGHDYSGTTDTFDNLRLFGSFGVLVRIGDKFMRLKNFYDQGVLDVTDEKIEDTMKDLLNYAYYLLILYRQEREEVGNELR
jgi:hypothetical protein